MIEFFSEVVAQGGVTLWLVLGSFVVPGLALVLLERVRGHETELKGPLWSAVFVPLVVALAGSQWRAAFPDAPRMHVFTAEGATRVVWIGLVLTLSLMLLAIPATSAARRRRKPLAPVARGALS